MSNICWIKSKLKSLWMLFLHVFPISIFQVNDNKKLFFFVKFIKKLINEMNGLTSVAYLFICVCHWNYSVKWGLTTHQK